MQIAAATMAFASRLPVEVTSPSVNLTKTANASNASDTLTSGADQKTTASSRSSALRHAAASGSSNRAVRNVERMMANIGRVYQVA